MKVLAFIFLGEKMNVIPTQYCNKNKMAGYPDICCLHFIGTILCKWYYGLGNTLC